MDKLLIAKTTVAYGSTRSVPGTAEGAVTPDLLAAGAIGIYGFHRFDDGIERLALITHVAATTHATPGAYKAKDTDYTGREVKFFLGANSANMQALGSTSQPRQSSEIQLKGIRRAVAVPYEAATFEVSTITPPALPTTASMYDEYFLHVQQTPVTKEVDTFSFSVTGIFANLAALATAFVNQINNRKNMPFTAAVSGNNIVITSSYLTKVLNFGFDGFLYGATVAKSTPMKLGNGNLYQIKYKEKNYGGEQGWQDQLDRRMPGIDALAQDDHYHVYLFDFVNTLDLKDETDDTFTNQETLTVAIPQGSPIAQVIENIFGAFYTGNKLSIVPQFNGTAQVVDGTTTTTTGA